VYCTSTNESTAKVVMGTEWVARCKSSAARNRVAAWVMRDSCVRIVSATFVDADVRVVVTSGGGSKIPLSRMTLLPNKRLAGEAPVLGWTVH
jgi:hypothetical protein